MGGSAEKGVSFGVFFLRETCRGQLLENEGFKKSAHGKGASEGGEIAPPPAVSFCGEDFCSGHIFGGFFFSGYCLGG